MKRRLVSLIAPLMVAAACGGAAAPAPASAAPTSAAPAAKSAAPTANPQKAVEDFYKGKTVRVVVGYDPGGGFDTSARIVARHIGKYIPGDPTLVVENMPGAGSLVAANWLYEVAPKDGTVFGTFNENQVLEEALGGEGIKFKSAKFSWLGSLYVSAVTCVARADAGFKSITDVIGSSKPLIVGGTGPGANTDNFPKMLRAALGANIKVVSGYKGSNGIAQAIKSGEVQAGCWSWDSQQRTELDAIKAGKEVVLVQQGDEKIAELPNVPMAVDVAKDARAKGIVLATVSPNGINKPFAAPPGVPAERLAALREAFAKMVKDPEFKAEITKAGFDLQPKDAAGMQKVIDQLFGLDQATIGELKAAFAAKQ